jgi:hypothetical protein
MSTLDTAAQEESFEAVGEAFASPVVADAPDAINPTLSPCFGLECRLNDRWRVTTDKLQWMLQHRRLGHDVWISRSWCRTRDGLLQCVKEHCDDVDPVSLATLRALPDYFIERAPVREGHRPAPLPGQLVRYGQVHSEAVLSNWSPAALKALGIRRAPGGADV